MEQLYVPGMRLLIRDEEWVVRKVDRNSRNTQTLDVQGISRLVKDRQAVFLADLETIEVVDPEQTTLVPDTSPFYRKSKLTIESLLRRKIPPDNRVYTGQRGAMKLLNYQLQPATAALEQPRQRVLLADGVGLGKTLEAGILVSELIARGKGKRILVVAVKSMMLQFQKEFWTRFTIGLKRLDSREIQKVRASIPSNHNPFSVYDRVIISIDTLKRDIEYRTFLENASWDIIIIDEAHNVAQRGKSQAQRSRLAELLAHRSDTLIMLSATPHDGRPASFASLVSMLDPTAIANADNYTREDIRGLVFRRFKKDVQNEVADDFCERVVTREECTASPEEERVFDRFASLRFDTLNTRHGGAMLFKTLLEKSLFSSPAACLKTLHEKIRRLEKREQPSSEHDIAQLRGLHSELQTVSPQAFSRYRKLVQLLKDPAYDWNPNSHDDRVVVFTERIETMKFLAHNLRADLALKDDQVQQLHGGMSDVDQQRVVDAFGASDAPVKILVASDVASEGINLHFLCHRLVHFDIPWSLMVFQQRNGRIDRYGQTRTPDIRYLVTRTENEQVRGDLRILEILVEKEQQAEKNIGDPATLMNLYDAQEEEKQTALAIEQNIDPDDFLSVSPEKPANPFLAMMSETFSGDTPSPTPARRSSNLPTIYSDLDFLREGLKLLGTNEAIPFESFSRERGITLQLPADLRHRLESAVPPEALPEGDRLSLSSAIDDITHQIAESRQKKEDTWPAMHFLWPLHPVMDWLIDRVDILFPRQTAPLLVVDELPPSQVLFLVAGLVPNRRSVPVVEHWAGILFENGQLVDVWDLPRVLQMRTFQQHTPNPDRPDPPDVSALQALLPLALQKSRELVETARKEFEDRTDPWLEEQARNLETLKRKHLHAIEALDTPNARTRELAERRKRNTERTFEEFWNWLEDTMLLEKDNPYIHVVAALAGGHHGH